MKGKSGFAVTGLMVMLLGCLMVYGLAGRGLGAWEAYKSQLEAQRLEAQARVLEQAAMNAQAQAALEVARGEAAILHQAAQAVAADRRLVTWYAVSSSIGGNLGLLVIGAAAGVWLTRGGSILQEGGAFNKRGVHSPSYERRPSEITRRQVARPYALGAVAGAVETWDEMRYEQPYRPASREADVVVPLLQALVSGGFAGAAVVALVGAAAWRFGWAWPVAPLAGLVAGGGITWSRWERLLDDSRGLLRRVEEFIKRDDGEVPELAKMQVEVHHKDKAGAVNRIEYDLLPLDEDALRHILTAHIGGRCQLSRRGLGELPGIGKDKARDILAALEKAGYISYPNGRNHPEGASLTGKGRAVARAW